MYMRRLAIIENTLTKSKGFYVIGCGLCRLIPKPLYMFISAYPMHEVLCRCSVPAGAPWRIRGAAMHCLMRYLSV